MNVGSSESNASILGRAMAQAVSRWASHRRGPGSIPGRSMWDLW
jgi:hypothetical protein